jgi:hypothetical protein
MSAYEYNTEGNTFKKKSQGLKDLYHHIADKPKRDCKEHKVDLVI